MADPAGPGTARVVILVLAGVAVALQVGKVPVALPFLRAELGLTLVQSGWVVSIFGVVAALSATMLGALSDRLGHLRTAMTGLMVTAAAAVWGSMAVTGHALLLSRLVEGVGFLLTVNSVPPMILRVARPDRQHTAMAFWGLYLPVGSFLMMAASGPMLEFLDWRALWLVTAALIVAAAVPIFLVGRRVPRPVSPQARPGLRQLLRPAPLLLGATFMFYTAQYFVVAGFLPLILIAQDGFSAVRAAMVGAGVVAMNALGNGVSGWLHGRGAGSVRLITIGAIAALILSVPIFALSLPPGWRIAAALGFGAFAGLVPSSLFAVIPALAARGAGVAGLSGVMAQASGMGQLLGPPLVAAFAGTSVGWGAAIPVMAGLAVAMLMAARLLGHRLR